MSSHQVISNPFSHFMDTKKRSSSWPKKLQRSIVQIIDEEIYEKISEDNKKPNLRSEDKVGRMSLCKIDGFIGFYKGEWADNHPQGRGSFDYKGSIAFYTGGFDQGSRHGKGIETYPCGSKFEGNFEHGYMEGQVEYKYDTGDLYMGEMHCGFRDGQGTLKYISGDCYKGQWKEDQKHGKGIYLFSSGESYEGDWRNGERHGLGKYVFANGQIFQGKYKEDIRQGKGALYGTNMVVIASGIWQNGLLDDKPISFYREYGKQDKNKNQSCCMPSMKMFG